MPTNIDVMLGYIQSTIDTVLKEKMHLMDHVLLYWFRFTHKFNLNTILRTKLVQPHVF